MTEINRRRAWLNPKSLPEPKIGGFTLVSLYNRIYSHGEDRDLGYAREYLLQASEEP